MTTLIARGNIAREMLLQITMNPNNGTNIAANTSVETSYTVQGIMVGDFIEINKPSHLAGLCIGNIRVPSANTINVQWCNITASPISPVSESYLVAVSRYELNVNPPASMPL